MTDLPRPRTQPSLPLPYLAHQGGCSSQDLQHLAPYTLPPLGLSLPETGQVALPVRSFSGLGHLPPPLFGHPTPLVSA